MILIIIGILIIINLIFVMAMLKAGSKADKRIEELYEKRIRIRKQNKTKE